MVEDIVPDAISAVDGVITGLSEGQLLYHTGAMGAAGDLGEEIGKLNDPDAAPALGTGNIGNVVGALQAYAQWSRQIGGQNQLHDINDSSDTAQEENAHFRGFGDIVRNSRDPFSSRRSYKWGMPFSTGVSGLGQSTISVYLKNGADIS